MKSFSNDQHLDVCQNIELGLKRAYEVNPLLTDSQCVMALHNAKIAIKKRFGYAQNESVSSNTVFQDVINWCVAVGLERIDKVNALTLRDYVALLEKIKQSVAMHSEGAAGSRRYYDFVKRFLA